jgi:hypothetical protein
MLLMTLVCLAITTVVACQVHVGPLVHAHAAPSEHHEPSTPHSTGDLTCLPAVLTSVILLPILLSMLFVSHVVVLSLASPVFPPFIPPKYATR